MNDTKELERKSISRVSMSLVSLLLFRKGKENYERNAVKKIETSKAIKKTKEKKKALMPPTSKNARKLIMKNEIARWHLHF